MISVLLVDDEALVRAGLRMILETADDLTVVGDAEDGRAAIDAVSRYRPDMVLTNGHPYAAPRWRGRHGGAARVSGHRR